ncbi:hypothetical protein YPPY36_4561, partial [Yersinia pestis PY-36]
MLSIY